MKKIQSIFLILCLMGPVCPWNARAETIRGEIKALNVESNNFVMLKRDPSKNKLIPRELNVQILPKTKLKGMNFLQELRTGDEIKVDVRQNKKTLAWEARSLR